MVPCWVQIGGAVQLLGRGDAELLADHEALAVVVIDGREIEAELGVARHRPGRVAGQHVHLARLERREAVLGGERDEADLGRVVEDRRRDGAAEIDVETGPVALRVRHAEAGEAGVRAAGQEALLLDAVQRRLSRGARGDDAGREAEGDRYDCLFHVGVSPTAVRRDGPADRVVLRASAGGLPVQTVRAVNAG